MADRKPTTTLPEVLVPRKWDAVAVWLEDAAADIMEDPAWSHSQRVMMTVPLLHAAATYRLVVAQEQTAYLLQRLVDAAEERK
jgi:serine acetyltransferase